MGSWSRRQWRPVVVVALMLSATSCGYAVGDLVGVNACMDHNGDWENGVCYDSLGSLSSLPHGWQAIDPYEISAVTGHAKDWGVLEPGAVGLDGDGALDLARILVDPSMTQFRLFVFYGKDDLAGDRAVALTEPQRIADVSGVSVSMEGPPGEPDRAPQVTLRRTIEGQRRDTVFAWRGDRLAEVAP